MSDIESLANDNLFNVFVDYLCQWYKYEHIEFDIEFFIDNGESGASTIMKFLTEKIKTCAAKNNHILSFAQTEKDDDNDFDKRIEMSRTHNWRIKIAVRPISKYLSVMPPI